MQKRYSNDNRYDNGSSTKKLKISETLYDEERRFLLYCVDMY
ncbi:protein of unknown function [Petrocella atlantisensis]|uniref:Uncharacterized protein n=1 Tax=Petrocella atlantisensis TaxID=2173034 RepID=A0A3P7RXV8_9FIRM|nr:protein of unknown function [Petrocella atlantisensis]